MSGSTMRLEICTRLSVATASVIECAIVKQVMILTEEAKLRVQKVADGIARGEFPPNPKYHCVFCPYRNLCPATERIVAAPRKKSAGRVH